MTWDELSEWIRQGHETTGVEFKGPGPCSNTQLRAKVVRAILGMVNRRNGGWVILGVADDDGTLRPEGLAAPDLASWDYDTLSGIVSSYADPYVTFTMDTIEHDGLSFLAIKVTEFEEIPVVCKRDYPNVLRDGACYVRRMGKAETSEIPNQAEMRALLELGIEKRVRSFIRQARAAGIDFRADVLPSDEDFFRAQAEDFE